MKASNLALGTAAAVAILALTASDATAGCRGPGKACGTGGCGSKDKTTEATQPECKGNVCASTEAVHQENVKHGVPPTIGTRELQTLISAKAAIVLDARSGKYDDGRRIPGAVALNDKSSLKEIESVVKDRNALIVTYCSNTKCPASDRLAKHLLNLGFKNILEYPEGIAGWTAAGNEVESAN